MGRTSVITKQHKKKLLKRRQAEVPGFGPSDFINRELSWIEFNQRVLASAIDSRNPLLERVKFLHISLSNLDEFFMKRVGGIKQQIAAGIVHQTPDGMTPHQELAAIRERVDTLLRDLAKCWRSDLHPNLSHSGVRIMTWSELSSPEINQVNEFFKKHVFPALTPLAVDPGHPFPFLANLSTSLGVMLVHPDHKDEKIFARVKVPEILPQLVKIGAGDEHKYIPLLDLIMHNLHSLFPGMVVVNSMPFRVTRNAEVELDALDADDLLDLIQEELRERKFAKVLRLEHGANPDPWMINLLLRELELHESDVYETLDLRDATILKGVADLNIPKLRYEPWTPAHVTGLGDDETNIFTAIRRGDVLVHHPYESFSSSVEKFVRAAAEDPRVVTIKATLYRTGEDSSIVPWLLRAAELGKQVACVIELKAHFDEARNIKWAREMEKAGIHVIYGLVGLKTHAKILMAVREEADGLCSYAHIGTGNYHSQTANYYTDLGVFTANPEVTGDLLEVFNFLTGKSLLKDYKSLMVAPFNMKDRFLSLIMREMEHAKQGRPAHIIAKMNSLEDHGMCKALYEASRAGVRIDLFVRGLCVLRPGVPGVSDNISVYSVLGRFLEHSRIFYFRNGTATPEEGEMLIGSADWMYRNLLNRVEVIAPVKAPSMRSKVWEVLTLMLADFDQTWMLNREGRYSRRTISPADTHSKLTTATQTVLMSRLNSQRPRCD
jgi:polyphosphate kinase